MSGVVFESVALLGKLAIRQRYVERVLPRRETGRPVPVPLLRVIDAAIVFLPVLVPIALIVGNESVLFVRRSPTQKSVVMVTLKGFGSLLST
jgi:hypothetical protein